MWQLLLAAEQALSSRCWYDIHYSVQWLVLVNINTRESKMIVVPKSAAVWPGATPGIAPWDPVYISSCPSVPSIGVSSNWSAIGVPDCSIDDSGATAGLADLLPDSGISWLAIGESASLSSPFCGRPPFAWGAEFGEPFSRERPFNCSTRSRVVDPAYWRYWFAGIDFAASLSCKGNCDLKDVCHAQRVNYEVFDQDLMQAGITRQTRNTKIGSLLSHDCDHETLY